MLHQMNNNTSDQNHRNSEIYKKPMAITDGKYNGSGMNNKKVTERKYDSKYNK